MTWPDSCDKMNCNFGERSPDDENDVPSCEQNSQPFSELAVKCDRGVCLRTERREHSDRFGSEDIRAFLYTVRSVVNGRFSFAAVTQR